MELSCKSCHQKHSKVGNLSRHISGRCLFQHEQTDSDLKLKVKNDVITIVDQEKNLYQKIQLCLANRSACPSDYPFLFTPKGTFSTNPSIRYLSEIGAVNRYDLLSSAIQHSPEGFISLPKLGSIDCNNCPEQLVLSGITKPHRPSRFQVIEKSSTWDCYLISRPYLKLKSSKSPIQKVDCGSNNVGLSNVWSSLPTICQS